MTERSTDNEPTTDVHVERSNEANGERGNVDVAAQDRAHVDSPPGAGTTSTGAIPGSTRSLLPDPPAISSTGTDCPRSPEPALAKTRLTPERYLAALSGEAPTPAPARTSNRPRKYTKRTGGDDDAPLPFFRKPAALKPIPPHMLRRPPEDGEHYRPDRRSADTREAEQAAALAEREQLLATPDQIPPTFSPDQVWQTIIAAYKTDPVGFTTDVLNVTPDAWQAEAMRAIARGERRLSVRAGHGVGKSAFCAWLVIWHAITRFPQKTVITAPTQGQLFDALFAEVKSWFRKLPAEILSRFDLQSDRIIYRELPEDSFISARTSSKERPESLAGVHCDLGSVLIVCDEASAIPEEVFESASGSMSGKTAHTILISNPTRNTGLFHASHNKLSRNADPVPKGLASGDSLRNDHDHIRAI